MKKMFFITSGKINYEFRGKSLYESIKITARGEKFPHILKDANREILKTVKLLRKKNIDAIFSAASDQCMDTSQIISKYLPVPLESKSYLMPLKFKLESFFSEDEFLQMGDKKFSILRKRFIESFYKNILIEDNKEISKRFSKLLHDSKDYKNILIVSHAYLIKLFSIYYKLGDRIYKDKNLLIKMFNPEAEPMKRLELLEIKI